MEGGRVWIPPPPPVFICENNRKSNKIVHYVDIFFYLLWVDIWGILYNAELAI